MDTGLPHVPIKRPQPSRDVRERGKYYEHASCCSFTGITYRAAYSQRGPQNTPQSPGYARILVFRAVMLSQAVNSTYVSCVLKQSRSS